MSQQINLFNPLYRRKAFSLLSSTGMLYAAGVAFAIAALIAVYQQFRLREIEAQAQAVERSHREAAANLEKLVAELAKWKPSAQLAAEIAALESLLSDRQEVIAALKGGVVGNTDGFSGYLRAFSRQSVSGLWLTGFDIAMSGTALALKGRTLSAEHVASYLQRLNQEQTMQGRQFAAMRISQPPEPAADAGANERSEAKERKLTAPRYLEFMISTLEIPDAQSLSPTAAAIAPPLLGSLAAAAGPELAPAATQEGAR